MFKKIFVFLSIVLLGGTVAFSAYNASQVHAAQAMTADPAAIPLSIAAGNPNPGNGPGNPQAQGTQSAIPAGDLSEAESTALLFMFEEEKLAHDVYTALYATWGLTAFQNIAASEQMHMNAIQTLLERYALTGPSNAEGVFDNADLQALYSELVARGNQSLAEALKVGGAIEEIDILDLQTHLAETDNADIQQVFTNLMNGSYNHLNAFAGALLRQTGEIYQPQYLSAEAYQALAATQPARGNGGQGGGKGNRGGRP